jgi:hypothetical protein
VLGFSLYSCPYLNWQNCYIFLIIPYVYTLTKLEKRVEQVLPRREEGRVRRKMWGQGDEMAQRMHTRMNK